MLKAWLTAKFAGTERAQHFHTLFEREARHWREWGGKQHNRLHSCQCGLEGWVFWIKEQTRPQASPSPHPSCVPLTNLGSWDSGEPEPLLVSEWEGEGAVAVWPTEDAAAGTMKGEASELCCSDLAASACSCPSSPSVQSIRAAREAKHSKTEDFHRGSRGCLC